MKALLYRFFFSCCYLVVKKRKREKWVDGIMVEALDSRVKEEINFSFPPQAQLSPILLVPDTQRREREKNENENELD